MQKYNIENLYIVGAGGLGRETLDIFRRMNLFSDLRFRGFIDDSVCGDDIKSRSFIKEHIEDNYVVAIGSPQIRRLTTEDIERYNNGLCTIRDPSVVSRSCGNGCIIFPNSFVSTNTVIGKSVIIYSNVYIGHDSIIESFTTICPGVNIGGWSSIGKCCFLGIGSTVSNNISICDNTYVGAGACVVENINEPGTYVGVPARKIHD